MHKIEIRCFGLLQVTAQETSFVELERSPILRHFLGYLILHRNQTLSRSRIAGCFWPEVPELQARRNLNNLLWRLRQLAGGILSTNVCTTRDTLCWELSSDTWLDLEEFESRTGRVADIQAGATVIDETVLSSLAQTITLYRGELLSDCEADWCEQSRLRFQELYSQVLRLLVIGYEQREMPERALRYAKKLVQAELYQEWGHEAVVRLHLHLNQPQAALLAHQEYVSCWQNDLGLSPSPRMQQLLHTVEDSDGATSPENVLTLALAQLSEVTAGAASSKTLTHITQTATYNLCGTLIKEVERIGEAAEAEYAWQVAQRAYQTGLAVFASLPDEQDFLQRQFNLRLRCDTLYDRLAQRQAQAYNLNQALNLAKKLKDKAMQSEVCARLCWVATGEGKLQEAVSWGEKARMLAERNQRLRAQAFRLLGTSYELQGIYTKALANHLEAVTLDLAQPEFLVMDHNNVASVYMALGEDWLAWQHIQEAWAMTPTKPPRLIQAVILGNLANSARELGDFATAVTHLLTAQKIAGILGSRENEIWLATRASTLYRQKGDITRARQWASYAWQESQIINHPRCAVEAAMECFRLALLEDKPLAAEQWIQKLGELLTINELGRYQGVVLLLHALNLLQNNDVKAAEEIAHGGMQIVQERNEHRYLSFAHALTSLIALQQRNMREADRCLMSAHQALHERANKISDLIARERFLQATPFRMCLNAREYPSLTELFQYS